MDNMFFRFFIEYWPVLLAIMSTFLLIHQWMRPKVTPEKLQKGMIRQGILQIAEDRVTLPADEEKKDWYATYRHLEPSLQKTDSNQMVQRIHYQNYLTIALCWVLFWSAASTFLIIRLILNFYYYGNEAIFLGYFAYYIIIGLISYFKR